MKTIIAIALLALGCGAQQDNADAQSDNGVTDQDSEFGSTEQAYSIEVASSGTNRIFGIPKTFQEYYQQCDSSAQGTSTSCQGNGNLLTGPAHTTFVVASASTFIRDALTVSCGRLAAQGIGYSCSVSSSCTGASLCVQRTTIADIHGYGTADLRRFQTIGCMQSSANGTASFNGVSYQLKRCDIFVAAMDQNAIGAMGLTAAQQNLLGEMVTDNLLLQSIGVGGVVGGTGTSNRWNYGLLPANLPTFMSTGQKCRTTHNNVSQVGSFSFTTSSGCLNN